MCVTLSSQASLRQIWVGKRRPKVTASLDTLEVRDSAKEKAAKQAQPWLDTGESSH